jgi:hypothetical protein
MQAVRELIVFMAARHHLFIIHRPLLCILALAVSGCSPKVHLVAESKSPDNRKIARVYEEEALPLVGTSSFVYVTPLNRAQDENTDLVFRGDDMNGRNFGPLNISWSDATHLHVGYCSGNTETFRNNWFDHKAERPDLTEIVVALDLEPPGQWPASRPVNTRGGDPPCN